MRVKVCGIQNESDLKKAIDSDADAVGFLVGQIHQSARFILPSTAGRLARQLPPYISPVIVTHLINSDEIIEILDRAGIYCVQLHGKISFHEIEKLRNNLPDTARIILSTYLVDRETSADLDEVYPFIDAVLLDCFNIEPNQIGIFEGKEYLWALGADFVRKCPLPVVLGGGLTPGNVTEAINRVKPYAVDACSGLRMPDSEECCLEKCRKFVFNAKIAGFKLAGHEL